MMEYNKGIKDKGALHVATYLSKVVQENLTLIKDSVLKAAPDTEKWFPFVNRANLRKGTSDASASVTKE